MQIVTIIPRIKLTIWSSSIRKIKSWGKEPKWKSTYSKGHLEASSISKAKVGEILFDKISLKKDMNELE